MIVYEYCQFTAQNPSECDKFQAYFIYLKTVLKTAFETTKKHGKLKYTAKQSFSKHVPSEVTYFPDVVSVFWFSRFILFFDPICLLIDSIRWPVRLIGGALGPGNLNAYLYRRFV